MTGVPVQTLNLAGNSIKSLTGRVADFFTQLKCTVIRIRFLKENEHYVAIVLVVCSASGLGVLMMVAVSD